MRPHADTTIKLGAIFIAFLALLYLLGIDVEQMFHAPSKTDKLSLCDADNAPPISNNVVAMDDVSITAIINAFPEIFRCSGLAGLADDASVRLWVPSASKVAPEQITRFEQHRIKWVTWTNPDAADSIINVEKIKALYTAYSKLVQLYRTLGEKVFEEKLQTTIQSIIPDAPVDTLRSKLPLIAYLDGFACLVPHIEMSYYAIHLISGMRLKEGKSFTDIFKTIMQSYVTYLTEIYQAHKMTPPITDKDTNLGAINLQPLDELHAMLSLHQWGHLAKNLTATPAIEQPDIIIIDTHSLPSGLQPSYTPPSGSCCKLFPRPPTLLSQQEQEKLIKTELGFAIKALEERVTGKEQASGKTP